jgi:hypothetical protein
MVEMMIFKVLINLVSLLERVTGDFQIKTDSFDDR